MIYVNKSCGCEAEDNQQLLFVRKQSVLKLYEKNKSGQSAYDGMGQVIAKAS